MKKTKIILKRIIVITILIQFIISYVYGLFPVYSAVTEKVINEVKYRYENGSLFATYYDTGKDCECTVEYKIITGYGGKKQYSYVDNTNGYVHLLTEKGTIDVLPENMMSDHLPVAGINDDWMLENFGVKIGQGEGEEEEDEPEDPGDWRRGEEELEKIYSQYAQYGQSGESIHVRFVYAANGATTTRYYSVKQDSEGNRVWTLESFDYDLAMINTWNKKQSVLLSITEDQLASLGLSVPKPSETREEVIEESDVVSDFGLDDVIDGAAGLVLFPAKLLPLILGKVMEKIMTVIAGNGTLTLQDILFNEVPLVNVNFFNASTNDTANKIRTNVAVWYTSFRNLSAIIIAIIAVYVGIRMAINVSAEEKAKYKQMLLDWLFGLALLFVLHYIILFVFEINDALIRLMQNGLSTAGGEIDSQTFFDNGLKTISFVEGFGNAIAYLLITGITFMFLLTYVQRMVKLAFLVIIAPLVTATYSIDRMGDQKSQALNAWFKEFAYNVLIQPFQCVTYLAICSLAITLLSGSPTLADAAIAIFMLVFIFEAEKIVRHIFHFDQGASIPGALGNATVFASLYGLATKSKKSKSSSDDDGGEDGNQSGGRRVNTSRQANNNNNGANNGQNNNPGDNGSGNDNGGNGNNGNDNGGNGGSSDNGNNGNDNNQEPTTRQRVANALTRAANSRAVQTWIGLNAKAAGLATGIGLGAATGKMTATFATAKEVVAKSDAHAANYDRNRNKRNLARAYNTYRANNEGLTDDQIRQNAMALANGDMDATTQDQIELREAILSIRKRYEKDGLGDKKINKTIDKDFDAIEDGKYGELTESARFVGSIRSKFRRNNNNRYS